jgi:hypothetical protein
MIVIITGNVGEGKTVTAVKEIVTRANFPVTNFNLKNIDYYRLRYADIVTKDFKVNWNFWDKFKRKHKNFSVYLDEAHSVISSRRAMSKNNICFSRWLAQIRKILSDDENNHLFIITQTLRKIDVDFRDLAHMIIDCEKKVIGHKVIIFEKFYFSISKFEAGFYQYKTYFEANKFFKYYDTLGMVKFSDADEYV